MGKKTKPHPPSSYFLNTHRTTAFPNPHNSLLFLHHHHTSRGSISCCSLRLLSFQVFQEKAALEMARGENQDVRDNIPTTAMPRAVGPTKQSAPLAKSADGQSVLKRLQSELMALMMCGDPGISAFPEGDNIFSWKGTITGGKDTAYEGMIYKLSLNFSNDYPFKPPKVRFDTPCFHPNVDVYGAICLDILQDKWSSAYDVRTILLSIQSLLGEPNNDSPLNTQAAGLWSNQEEFRKMVEKVYKPA